MNPITGVACARAASGHAAAALPIRAIKSRRLTSGMGSPSEPAVSAYRTPRLPGRYRQVLGADLNCSEPRCCGAPPHSGRWPVRVQTRYRLNVRDMVVHMRGLRDKARAEFAARDVVREHLHA